MNHSDDLEALLRADAERQRLLRLVQSLQLPDCWVGAGFVRNAVWDSLHGRPPSPPAGDVDVIWFDVSRNRKRFDVELEERLKLLDDSIDWSVKNQSRMHVDNDDRPYRSTTDAMSFWPETATAVAVRLIEGNGLEVAAPFGLDDLYAGVIRPTPHFLRAKRAIFDERVLRKEWLRRWPSLRVEFE
jgi:hypothetical protein